jgi:prepilin-type N-terminal cleavage/methylation domain-containing protein
MSHPVRHAVPRGFSLVEVLVASAIFLFVALAAYTAWTQSYRAYDTGQVGAEMQQRTRLAFDLMASEVRLAGYDYNRDGDGTLYADEPGEQVEFASEHAITFRANLDFGDATTGREADYELAPGDPGYGVLCCPIVTIGNEEIITYALRSDDASANASTITIQVDTTAPRDAGWDDDGALTGEETVEITNVDLTDLNPPYTLMRFAIAADGSVTETPVAIDIRSLTFRYEGADGSEEHCSSFEADGTCSAGASQRFDEMLGSDDNRDGRAGVREIAVELVGMTSVDDPAWTDPDDTVMPNRRKLALTETVVPQNLGIMGEQDQGATDVEAPTNVTLCGGQCNTVRVEWDAVMGAASYRIKLFLPSATEPFFTGNTPGVQVVSSDPERVFAVFQSLDAPEIVDGAAMTATVTALTLSDAASDESLPCAEVTLSDVARLEATPEVAATGYDPSVTGWPDVVTYDIAPTTEGTSLYLAQANQVTVSWLPPTWMLDVTDQTDPANTWTTVVDDSTSAAISCDAEPVDEDPTNQYTENARLRTRARELIGSVKYYVFRSEDPRFIPTAADLVGQVAGNVDLVNGRISFTDQTVHVYRNAVFNSTQAFLENCNTYYYRVRAVDACFAGSDPSVRTNPHLSPFSPPLNPDPTAEDSDDVSVLSPSQVGLAAPGYAVPQAEPRAPRELRFRMYDRQTNDGDGLDVMLGFDAVKKDNHVVPDPAYEGLTIPDFDDITISEYRLYRHPSDPAFTPSTASAELVKTITVRPTELRSGRIDYDDEDGSGVVTTAEDESLMPYGTPSGSPWSGLRLGLADTTAYWYKVAAVQCVDEATIPAEDPTAWDAGLLSSAVRFPCDFGGGPYSSIIVDATLFPDQVVATSYMDAVDVWPETARLILADPATGDRAMTPEPGRTVPDIGIVTFDAFDIAQLTDNFGSGEYRVAVEMTDSNGCIGTSDDESAAGDLPGCCMTPPEPVVTEPTTRALRTMAIQNPATCTEATLRIFRIRVVIDNASGGQQEKFSSVSWGSTRIWAGPPNRTDVTISLPEPLVLGPGQSQQLNMGLDRDGSRDRFWVVYSYRIGGSTGSCTWPAGSSPGISGGALVP